MKKIKRIALLVLVFAITACTLAAATVPLPQPEDTLSENSVAAKIGIITGSASLSEEGFLAAEKMKEKYVNMIETATYPDDYINQPDAIESEALALAENGCNAIIFGQAVEGTGAAIDKVIEAYPDTLIILGQSAEDASVISSKADIIMNVDEIGMGKAVVEQAVKMGAKTFVHYTFARHMSVYELSARRDKLKETCDKSGITFVDSTVPDPTTSAGALGAQSFIVEDVERKVLDYGKETAFFSTDSLTQEALISAVLKTGALYPQQNYPSPYLGYPEALGITIPDDKKGDTAYLMDQIKASIEERDATGRFSTWAVPVDTLFIEAGVEYAVKFLNGEIVERNNKEALEQICNGIIGGSGAVTFSNYETIDGTTLDNFYILLTEFIDF